MFVQKRVLKNARILVLIPALTLVKAKQHHMVQLLEFIMDQINAQIAAADVRRIVLGVAVIVLA